jgi:hypothetical protein
MKTVLQVDSAEGFRNLMRRLKSGKLNVLYQGAFANAIAAIVGHYPWVRNRTGTNSKKLTKISHLLIMLRSLSFTFTIGLLTASRYAICFHQVCYAMQG